MNAHARVAPASVEAEEGVLGAMLASPQTAIPAASDILVGGDFYRESNGRLFHGIVRMWLDDSESVDQVTVGEEFPDEKDYIWHLAESCPVVSNVKHYAEIVKRAAVARSLILAGNEIAEMGYDEHAETSKLLDGAENKLMGLRPQHNADTHSVSALGRRVLKAIESGERPSMVSTGFKGIDEFAHGLHAGALTIVGARPGVGKTCLGLSVAQRVAKEHPVLFFSLEMRSDELMERLQANVGCVSLTHIRERNLTPDEMAAMYRAQGELEDCDLQFVDNTSMTMLALKSKVRKYTRTHGLKLVIVDYLQLMRMGTRCENRREEVSEMSRELKSLAMECGIHVLALSQLNRVSTFDGTKVDISQLKESGSLEQDADQVWLLSWPKEEQGARFVTVDIAKNRNGPLGATDLVWLPQYQRFEE